MKQLRPLCLALSFACLAANSLASAAAPPDAHARFIAGMSVEGTALQNAAASSRDWQSHAKEFNEAFGELKKRQLDPIAAWLPGHISHSAMSDGPLFYMFSGPDFLYANTFFPRAPTYILCGTEPVGNIPDVGAMDEDAVAHGLNTVRKSLEAVLNFSFFITNKMKSDLVESQLTGTLPLLYVFLARTGCQIEEVKLIHLDKEGKVVTDKTATPGVNIKFIGREGRKQQLYYFTTDLSNSGIKDTPGFMKFCEAQGIGHGFAKAASYLMHLDYFTTVRDFLLSHTRSMVQDDSGIPLRAFPQNQWLVLGYGHYSKPIDLFKEKYQPDLAELFDDSPKENLPFSFGYTWHKNESSLIYGISLSHVPKAKPVSGGE